jgi:hypothetical protein
MKSSTPSRKLRPRKSLIYRPGWPKDLPCLVCGRVRRSVAPHDRIHDRCQETIDTVYLK